MEWKPRVWHRPFSALLVSVVWLLPTAGAQDKPLTAERSKSIESRETSGEKNEKQPRDRHSSALPASAAENPESAAPDTDKAMVERIVRDYLKAEADKRKADEDKRKKEADAKGHEVGS